MDNKLLVDINSIDTFAKLLKEKSSVLNEIIVKLINASIDMEYYFDTPSGNLMRESLIEYLKKSKETCNVLMKDGINAEKISRIYLEMIKTINSEVGGDM